MFHRVDTEPWSRAQVFYYFSQMASTGYSFIVEVDVTEALRTGIMCQNF